MQKSHNTNWAAEYYTKYPATSGDENYYIWALRQAAWSFYRDRASAELRRYYTSPEFIAQTDQCQKSWDEAFK